MSRSYLTEFAAGCLLFVGMLLFLFGLGMKRKSPLTISDERAFGWGEVSYAFRAAALMDSLPMFRATLRLSSSARRATKACLWSAAMPIAER